MSGNGILYVIMVLIVLSIVARCDLANSATAGPDDGRDRGREP